MDRKSHLEAWDQLRLRHGITLRVIEQIPEDQLMRHPITGMRTPVELLVHMYAGLEPMVDSASTGELVSHDEKPIVAGITTRAQLLEFVKKAWKAGDAKARKLTDLQLARMVKTPWGGEFSGAAIVGFIYDEYQHHRGQLYAFVRTYGIEPVMVWDYDHNAAEFQPGAHAAG